MKVFQIPVVPGHYAGPEFQAWRETGLGACFYKPEYADYYEHVATVGTESPDEAYRLMNLWDEPHSVTKHKSCRSLSVGDILELDSGERLIVDNFGFRPVSKES